MKGIVDIQLARLHKLLADRKITLAVDDKARAWLAEAGYDPVYGARPLKRVIQRELQNPLAELILAGRIADGETVDGHAPARTASRSPARWRKRPSSALAPAPLIDKVPPERSHVREGWS